MLQGERRGAAREPNAEPTVPERAGSVRGELLGVRGELLGVRGELLRVRGELLGIRGELLGVERVALSQRRRRSARLQQPAVRLFRCDAYTGSSLPRASSVASSSSASSDSVSARMRVASADFGIARI